MLPETDSTLGPGPAGRVDVSSGLEQDESDGRRRRGIRRRELLIDAALGVIARDGVAGVTHGSVAEQAGVARSAVSHHFASIDELLTASLGAGTEQLVAAMAGLPADGELRSFAVELVRFFCDHRRRIVAGYELYLLAARRPALRPAVDLWLDLLRDIARRHTDDPARAGLFSAAVDGWYLQALATDTAPSADELEQLLRTSLL